MLVVAGGVTDIARLLVPRRASEAPGMWNACVHVGAIAAAMHRSRRALNIIVFQVVALREIESVQKAGLPHESESESRP